MTANVAALHLVQTLMGDKRPATVDEQKILAAWSSWGAQGLSQMFDEARPEYRNKQWSADDTIGHMNSRSIVLLVTLLGLFGCSSSTPPGIETSRATTAAPVTLLTPATVTKAVTRAAPAASSAAAIPLAWDHGQSWWAGGKQALQLKSDRSDCLALLLLALASRAMDMGGADMGQLIGPPAFDSVTEAAPFLLTSQSSGATANQQSIIAYLFDSEASAQRFASTVRTALGSCSAFQVSSSNGDETHAITVTSDGGFSFDAYPSAVAYTYTSRNAVVIYNQFVSEASPASTLSPGQVDPVTGLVVGTPAPSFDYPGERKAFLTSVAKELDNVA
jgi:hypothetical protein